MLLIKTIVGQSAVSGLGLFAQEKIKKGTMTWKFDSRFDVFFDAEQTEKMPEIQKNLIRHFAYFSKKSHKYVYSIDNSRFTNHSLNNNVDFKDVPEENELCGFANRDIDLGEEITINYRDLDMYDEKSDEDYLKNDF